jgi:N-acetylneuraminic acid mutarotase
LITARQQHTATLLQNGKVLVAGGTDNDTLSSAELYDPTSGTWSPTGALVTARYKHTATLLQNGKVLVTGGWNSNSNSLSSAELYDPTSGTWSPTGTLITAREQHTATLLQNGKVLVTGGLKRARDSNGSEVTDHLSSAELYDPANGTWSPTGTLITAREQHTATLLENGKVLVTGGLNSFNLDAPISSAELYDPASGTWSATGSLRVGRTDQAATLLPKAKVLVTGGIVGSNPLSSTELYDPVSGTWSSTAAMSVGRWFHTVTLLRSGKVLVTGGSNGYASVTPLSSAELYDPASSSWSPASNLITARYNHTATLLKNGKVLVAGGTDNSNPLSSSELYG